MNKKYKTTLFIIIAVLVVVILLGGGYFLYRYNKSKNQAVVIIDEELSINYLNGNEISFNDKKKEIQFSIINDSEDFSMFYISLENIETSSSKVSYSLVEGKNIIIKNEELHKESDKTISNFVEIGANDTKSYKLIINNPEKEKVNFKIRIAKTLKEDDNFSQLILNDNTINKETKTKIGEEIAVTDEGLIQDIDDYGNTFYFRGDVKNNYVNFANNIWRIVKINGDGTVKLVLNGTIDKSVIYTAEDRNLLENMKKLTNNKTYNTLDNWYNANLSEFDKYINQSKFCIDTNKSNENLNTYTRIHVSNNPTFNCLGTKNNSKIGLLTIDEVIYAGATINEQNAYFYLYNSNTLDSWWTLSPAKDAVEGLYYYDVNMNGGITTSSTGESTKSLKPVINLNKDVQMTGKGTIEEPYILK